jgi:hypothetical protein
MEYTQYPSKGIVLGFDILRVWKDKALTITSYDVALNLPIREESLCLTFLPNLVYSLSLLVR